MVVRHLEGALDGVDRIRRRSLERVAVLARVGLVDSLVLARVGVHVRVFISFARVRVVGEFRERQLLGVPVVGSVVVGFGVLAFGIVGFDILAFVVVGFGVVVGRERFVFEERGGDGVANGAAADADAHLLEDEAREESCFGRGGAVEQAEQAVALRALAPAPGRRRDRVERLGDVGDRQVVATAGAERPKSLLAADVEGRRDRTDLAALGEFVLDVARVDVRAGGACERLVAQRRPDVEFPVVPRREWTSLDVPCERREIVLVGGNEQVRDGRDDRKVGVRLLYLLCPVGERGELHRLSIPTGVV